MLAELQNNLSVINQVVQQNGNLTFWSTFILFSVPDTMWFLSQQPICNFSSFKEGKKLFAADIFAICALKTIQFCEKNFAMQDCSFNFAAEIFGVDPICSF